MNYNFSGSPWYVDDNETRKGLWNSNSNKDWTLNSLWNIILVRSRGAIVVFATAPATAPDVSELITSRTSRFCSSFGWGPSESSLWLLKYHSPWVICPCCSTSPRTIASLLRLFTIYATGCTNSHREESLVTSTGSPSSRPCRFPSDRPRHEFQFVTSRGERGVPTRLSLRPVPAVWWRLNDSRFRSVHGRCAISYWWQIG